MKKYLYFSIAALALASCSNDEFLGTEGTGQSPTGSDVIGFGGETLRPTRAQVGGSEAAEKLNNNFIVYGFKTNNDETSDAKVFDLYNVNYEEGTANTTESNTANWEYVGLNSVNDELQTIKYWDLSAEKYVFSAVSGTGITATKTPTGSTVYDKGWTINIPAGGSLSDLYASDRLVVTKAGTDIDLDDDGDADERVDGKYKDKVTLTFRALGTKIRFAMYETVPGYSVKIDRFYYKDDTNPWSKDETNFAINGAFKTANATTTTPLTVTYYDAASGIENRPKVTFEDANVTVDTYGTFGANIQAVNVLGTSSTEATYDQSDKSYAMILPFESATNNLTLYVDYTLTSTDNAHEKIEVKHASAKVPANYAQWKPNFAYTYIFKISDNTNGTTGELPDPTDPSDPNDPTVPIDPEEVGLYPITFDACIITDEEDVQETITTVAEPSITTYAQGAVVTENNEYVAGPVYYTIMNNGVLMNTAGGVSKVYEVNNFTPNSFETVPTEAIVDNYLNNFCVLTEVPVDFADNVPLTNGTNLTFDHGKCLQFTAEAGKTYAIMYDYNNGAGWKKAWKVVKVSGTIATPVTYTVYTDALDGSVTTATAISATDGTARIYVAQGGVGVLGVTPNFTIAGTTNGNKGLKIVETATAGVYTASVDAAAITAGKANDSYNVTFQNQTVTIPVSIAYVLRNAADDADITAVTVTAGNTTGATIINKIAGTVADGDVTEVPAGITVDKTATGTYKITAASTVAAGAYSAKIANQTLTINVDSYAFVDSRTFTLDYAGNADQQTLFLTKNNTEYADVEVSAMTGIDENVAKIIKAGAGIYAVVPMGFGSYTVQYENASAVITVYAYAMNDASVKKSTGKATLEVTLNNGSFNASASALKIYDSSSNDVTSNFTVSTNGKNIVLSNVKSTLTAGTYTAKYTVSSTVVAQSTITVTD